MGRRINLGNLTEDDREFLIANHISIPINLTDSELSNKSYVGKKGSCGYCGKPGSTKMVEGLETSILCDGCFYEEMYEDYNEI